MSNIAEYALIFQTSTSDDGVEKRIRAIADIKKWLVTLNHVDAIASASAVATAIVNDQPLPAELATKVESLIREHAKSFVRSEDKGELEVTVLLAAAVEDLIDEELSESGWEIVDALAAAFWSALGAQKPLSFPKLEKLRQNLLSASRRRVVEIGESSRRRQTIPVIGSVNIAQDAPPGQRVNQAFARAVEPLVNAMRDNAALDREELDFLWWLMSDRSDILNEPLASLDNAVRAITSGLDASRKLRKLPADAHRNIVLRNVVASDPLEIGDLLELIGEHRLRLSESLGPLINEAPAVFPFLLAVASGEGKGALSDIKLSPYDWGQRALLEGAIHHIQAQTSGGL